MMYWNVTYNDPNRWKAAHEASGGRLPWWRGVRETFAGLPVGSPKLDLVRVEGITELQELREDLAERTAINFSRTSAGLIAYTKVRLEVYAIPMRWNEQLVCSQEGAVVVQFQRGTESVRLHMQGAASAVANFRAWFARAAQ